MTQPLGAGQQQPSQQSMEEMVSFYTEATMDYRYWSPQFNMHFGYWRRRMNPFRREPMLHQMTEQALQLLRLPRHHPHRILDMGCGMGTSMHLAARHFAKAKVFGMSLVEAQVAQARAIAADAGLGDRLKFLRGDFTRSPFPNQTFDGIYALESLCHGPGPDKASAIEEAARLLKPGGQFVIADGFLKKPMATRGPLATLYRNTCNHWRLSEFAQITPFRDTLLAQGFSKVKVREISWRIAPSAMHIPIVCLKFLWHEWLLSSNPIAPERWSNMLASVSGLLLGLARPYFGYFLIHAER